MNHIMRLNRQARAWMDDAGWPLADRVGWTQATCPCERCRDWRRRRYELREYGSPKSAPLARVASQRKVLRELFPEVNP